MMSDRLTVSATMSVLMMSIYVLFGSDAARLPDRAASEHQASAAGLSVSPTQLLISMR
jgi:hypothetical protein